MSNSLSSCQSGPARTGGDPTNGSAFVIYTAGYQGRCPADLEECARRLKADVVDIRLSPFSQQPGWSKSDLQAQLGPAYRHVPALGNINYKSGGDVRIADIALGLKILLAPDRQRTGRPAIVLCGCRNEATCHRAVIAEALRDQGIHAEELNWHATSPPDLSAPLDLSMTAELSRTLERLHEYVIRLRCEDPAKGTRGGAFIYLQAQADKLATRSAEAGGTDAGWPDPADVLADMDQITGLREALAELTRPDAPYPMPLPPGCWLLPTANFDVFAAGRLYNGKVTDNGKVTSNGTCQRGPRA